MKLTLEDFVGAGEGAQATPERRGPQGWSTRRALTRLRLAEFVAADHLPPDLIQELTAAIDGVVAILRGDV